MKSLAKAQPKFWLRHRLPYASAIKWVMLLNDAAIGFLIVLACCIGVWLYAKYAGWLKEIKK
jgi:hypothetical protein